MEDDMLRNILGFTGVHGTGDTVIKTLMALQEKRETHATVMAVAGVPYYEYISAEPVSALFSVSTAHDACKIYEAEAQAAVEKLTAKLKSQLSSVDVEPMIEGLSMLYDKVAVRGRYADLSVIGPVTDFKEPWCWTQIVEALLFQTGRPLLVVPNTGAPAHWRKVVLAWNGRPEAVRAWHEAKTWLAPGAQVDILIIDTDRNRAHHGAEPGADMATALARQGFVINVHRQESNGAPVADLLQSFASAAKADVLIMGAYGHTRLREFLFGGATRDVLANTTMPVFLSH
jgi:nucleotide-binding universal stress UspA family protein